MGDAKLPDVGYFYALKSDAPAIRAHGAPSGAIIHMQRLTYEQVIARHGFPRDAEIVCFPVNLKAMREAGLTVPQPHPAPPDSGGLSQSGSAESA
ncbi:MAG: hypothetical protein P4L93_03410 [Coriobacteriia bacterium]|nr:hypothetical protein [Coriobacteriia bacterium]